MKNILKGDTVLVHPLKKNVDAGYFAGHEFEARVINVYPHAVVVCDQEDSIFDCEWDEVDKIEE